MVDIPDILRYSAPYLNGSPQGEAPVTVGSVLHHWEHGLCDGVAIASPWGCAPALVAESILKHHQEIPSLYIYTDGTPLDERRIRSFAFRFSKILYREDTL